MARLLREIDALPYDIHVNRELDRFYYMQKLAELKVLDDKLREMLERVSVMMTGRCERRKEMLARWKRDMRWLAVRNTDSAFEDSIPSRLTPDMTYRTKAL